jgi:hypothetical protein
MTKKSRDFRKAKRAFYRDMRALDNRYALQPLTENMVGLIGFKFIDLDSVVISINSPGGYVP